MLNIKKELRLYIEAEIRDYHNTRKALEELRDDILNESPAPADGMPRGGVFSDPTHKRAVKLLTNRRIKYMGAVVTGIGNVLSELDKDKLRLVELKYWQRPRKLTDAGIAIELHVDKTTVWRWANAICLAVGIELGLVDEVSCNKGAIFEG